MKKLIKTQILLLMYCPNVLYSQGTLKPVIISPFVGEKLDRIEEDYFQLLPILTDFQEATFYLNTDSSLLVNIKGYHRKKYIDTTLNINISLSDLREKINKVLLDDIEKNKVQELGLSTYDNNNYEGTIYSINDDQIELVKENFADINFKNNYGEYFETIKLSELKTVTTYESKTSLIVGAILIGVSSFYFIGEALAPETGEVKQPDPFGAWLFDAEPYQEKNKGYIFISMCVGGILGYFIGQAIKFPIEYNSLDEEAKRIIKGNTLLPSGL